MQHARKGECQPSASPVSTRTPALMYPRGSKDLSWIDFGVFSANSQPDCSAVYEGVKFLSGTRPGGSFEQEVTGLLWGWLNGSSQTL